MNNKITLVVYDRPHLDTSTGIEGDTCAPWTKAVLTSMSVFSHLCSKTHCPLEALKDLRPIIKLAASKLLYL